MVIIELTYKASMDEVEKHFEGHMAWLKRGYSEGVFTASGRKIPRTGGVILAKGEKDAVEAFCKEDPFVFENVADFALTEVDFSMTADGFDCLKEA